MQGSYYVDETGLHLIALKDSDGTDVILTEDELSILDEISGEMVAEMD